MNKKKIIFGIFMLLIIILLMAVIPNYCYAEDKLGLGDLNKYEGTNNGSSKLEDKAGKIFTSIRNIGTVLSVVILMVIGVKYIIGSTEEKANYKETLIPYLIGAILLFTGSLIPQIIYKIMEKF